MRAIARKVCRAPEDVQDAPIDLGATQFAKRLVHLLWILCRKILNSLEAQVAKVLGDTRPDAGNRLEFT